MTQLKTNQSNDSSKLAKIRFSKSFAYTKVKERTHSPFGRLLVRKLNSFLIYTTLNHAPFGTDK